MQAANISAALLAVTLWAAPVPLTAAFAADAPVRAVAAGELQERSSAGMQAQAVMDVAPILEEWREVLAASLSKGWALLQAGYERAPALVAVLAALLVLPAAALVSFLVRTVARRKARRAALRAVRRKAQGSEWTSEVPASSSIPALQQEAWLTAEDESVGTLPLAGQMIRIGRHQDNDIRLADTSVHRYHAVIERTAEEAFVITDLSGKEGNGLRVNGERLARAQLSDGDVIELGRTRLKFESIPV